MLYGDRNFLKASVTKSLVELQTRLINLYVSNLRSLGTQATLMGFFCVEGKQMLLLALYEYDLCFSMMCMYKCICFALNRDLCYSLARHWSHVARTACFVGFIYSFSVHVVFVWSIAGIHDENCYSFCGDSKRI